MDGASAGVAASAGAPSLLTTGAGCEGVVVRVTVPASSRSSCCTRVTPKTTAALHAATNTDPDATIFAIEIGVITSSLSTLQPNPAPILFVLQVRPREICSH